MHQDLVVSRQALEEAEGAWDYLYVILEKYYQLHTTEPEKAVDLLNDDQHTLFAYSILDGQVCNGGFIQVIYNGYGSYIFDSPLITILRQWGAVNTSELLEKVSVLYNEGLIKRQENDSLEDFSQLYDDNPEFEAFDDLYYEINNDDVEKVKQYVEQHLAQFIQVV